MPAHHVDSNLATAQQRQPSCKQAHRLGNPEFATVQKAASHVSEVVFLHVRKPAPFFYFTPSETRASAAQSTGACPWKSPVRRLR